MSVQQIRSELKKVASKEKAEAAQWFFKTGPGEYGEGDVFIGVRVPDLRKLARKHRDLSLTGIRQLLRSRIHEERLFALFLLVRRARNGDEAARKQIYELYLKNTNHVNNWDLVDASAEHIVGAHLLEQSKDPLYRLVKSGSLWERRIAIIATYHFIKQGRFSDTLKLARLLLGDREDLIHKAVGWMLREVGNRDRAVEESFLKKHYKKMPRTMLRYAIEKFPEAKRQAYLRGRV